MVICCVVNTDMSQECHGHQFLERVRAPIISLLMAPKVDGRWMGVRVVDEIIVRHATHYTASSCWSQSFELGLQRA